MKPPEERLDPNTEAPPEGHEAEPLGEESVATAEKPAEAAAPREPLTEEEMSYLEQLQRLQAEFSNYRRRIQRERASWESRAKGDVLVGLLPILDDLDRARSAIGKKPKAKDAEGLLLILSRLEDSLTALGLESQNTEPGVEFDPNYHDAVMTEASDKYPEGAILATIQTGYTFQGILLRPARVQVSRGSEEDSSDTTETEEK